MRKIIRGVHEFQKQVFSEHRELFERLARGQRPETMMITCADSRIDPNLLTQAQPGELFTIRNAGNIVPPYSHGGGEAAAIEFALSALHVRDIIVCGHTHCGAMQGVLNPEKLGDLAAVRQWLRYADETRRILLERYQDESGDALLTDAAKENVLVQLEHLREHPLVARGIDAGELHLHGWMYEIETGTIFAYDPEQQQFLPVTS